ncbi:type II toxin-antitoxin system VapC family toxin [Candidatus Fermentibacterales bacterium]|nr:type II toxin-antitoxin system VapC family toxin [Candidatus Fermentibacterales bacterium]
MSGLVLVDTDVLIDFLRGDERAAGFMDSHLGRTSVSAISVAEVFAGVRSDRDAEQIDALFSTMEILPVTAAIARQAGIYRGRYRASHGTGIADAVVAATAEAAHAQLATLNTRHFPMIEGVEPPYRKP